MGVGSGGLFLKRSLCTWGTAPEGGVPANATNVCCSGVGVSPGQRLNECCERFYERFANALGWVLLHAGGHETRYVPYGPLLPWTAGPCSRCSRPACRWVASGVADVGGGGCYWSVSYDFVASPPSRRVPESCPFGWKFIPGGGMAPKRHRSMDSQQTSSLDRTPTKLPGPVCRGVVSIQGTVSSTRRGGETTSVTTTSNGPATTQNSGGVQPFPCGWSDGTSPAVGDLSGCRCPGA